MRYWKYSLKGGRSVCLKFREACLARLLMCTVLLHTCACFISVLLFHPQNPLRLLLFLSKGERTRAVVSSATTSQTRHLHVALMHIHNFFLSELRMRRTNAASRRADLTLSALNPAQFPLRCLFELCRAGNIYFLSRKESRWRKIGCNTGFIAGITNAAYYC